MVALRSQSTPFSLLVAVIRRGGPDAERAFSQIFSDHARPLRAYIDRRMADDQLADDLVQECFLRFLRSARAGVVVEHAAYLWRVADSVMVDSHRRETAARRGQSVTEPLVEQHQRSLAVSGPEAERMELLACIEKSLSAYVEQHPAHASVVELAIVQQWSIEEMAEYLQRGRAATRQFLYEVRKKLRALVLAKCGAMM